MITIYATVSLRLVTFISKVALYPPSLSVLVLKVAILLETISKAFPVFRVIFSSFGVWLIRSSPINYKELSAKQEKLRNKNNLNHQLLIRRKQNIITIHNNKNNKKI